MNSRATLPSTGGHLLIISHDVIGRNMAGPGIRYRHLAKVLARELESEIPVVLAVPPGSTLEDQSAFCVLRYDSMDDPALGAALAGARAVFLPAIAAASIPALATSRVPVCVDGYNPFVAETLFLDPGAAAGQRAALASACQRGDFFVCASDRQRDWWLGALEAAGRVNALNHEDDPSFRRLVDLVPFGLPSETPVHRKDVIRSLWPAIGPRDRIVLWSGGLWPWLDPMTAVRAMELVSRRRDDVRLVFPGTRHPNPESWGMRTHVGATEELARTLGLHGRSVFFGEWVSYDDWPDVLLGSHVGLTLHAGETLESRLAFRSRVLEHVWAGLPTVMTPGDVTAELVERYGVGRLVKGDPEAVAATLIETLDTPRGTWAEGFSAARKNLSWEEAARPLAAFCRRGRPAPDRERLEGGEVAIPLAEPLPAEGFQVAWRKVSAPSRVLAGEAIPVRVTFANVGPVTWPDVATASPSRSGDRAVRLAHGLASAGSAAEAAPLRKRVDLSAPLGPREEASLSFAAAAPHAAGRHVLRIDLVQEGVAWFSAMGSSALELEIEVVTENR